MDLYDAEMSNCRGTSVMKRLWTVTFFCLQAMATQPAHPPSEMHAALEVEPHGASLPHPSVADKPVTSSLHNTPYMRREADGGSAGELHISATAAPHPADEHDELLRHPRTPSSQPLPSANDADIGSLVVQSATQRSRHAHAEAHKGSRAPSLVSSEELSSSDPASVEAPTEAEVENAEASETASSPNAAPSPNAASSPHSYATSSRKSRDPFNALADQMQIPYSQRLTMAMIGFVLMGGASLMAWYIYQQQKTLAKAPRAALGKGGKGLGKGLGKGTAGVGKGPTGKAAGKGKPPIEGKSGLRDAPALATYTRSDESSSDIGGKRVARKLVPPDMKSQFAVAEFVLPQRGVPPGLGGGKPGLPPTSLTASRASSMIGVESSMSDRPASVNLAPSEVSTDVTAFHGAAGSVSKLKSGNNRVQDLVSMLRSVECIQAAWRRWKAEQGTPDLGQKITLSCNVIQGNDMPNVNRLGGCDPFVECRIVRGDPSVRDRGDVDRAPLYAARTEVKRNEMNPRWDEKLLLVGIPYDRDFHVQLVLWDYNLMRNTPIAHATIPLKQALRGAACYSNGKQRGRLHVVGFHPLAGGEDYTLATKVSLRFGFWQTQRHRLSLISGSWLPKVKMLGTISSYVEARVVRGDPRKASFQQQPSRECVWSGRTLVVTDKVDPVWNQEFSFTVDAEPFLWLHLILWDTNSPLPDMPIGQAVQPLMQVKGKSGGTHGEAGEQHLQLEDIPRRTIAADLSRAKLVIKTSCKIVSTDDSEEEE